MAERLSLLCKRGVPGLPEDLRYTYTKAGFVLSWGHQQPEPKSHLFSFEELRTLDDEGIRRALRTSAQQ
ncbi:MAG: hypothetical protein HYY96_07585 [Candidatus Tectomicrobia bacterium]|nr:hypothetical protein [Candidatus Tectomicrobia bacterium]